MKNVSILSKLFLVSALMVPCGQVFGMKQDKQKTNGFAEYARKQTINAGKGFLKKVLESDYVQTSLDIGKGAIVGGTLATGFYMLSGGLPEVWKGKFIIAGSSAVGGFCGYLLRNFKCQKRSLEELKQKVIELLEKCGKTNEMVALLLLEKAGKLDSKILNNFIQDNGLEDFVENLNKQDDERAEENVELDLNKKKNQANKKKKSGWFSKLTFGYF